MPHTNTAETSMTIFLRFLFAGLIVVIVLFCSCIWIMRRPQTRTTSGPVSLPQFQTEFANLQLQLPSSAGNIGYAQSSVGLSGRAQIYRFDAPLADCQAYAQNLIKSAQNQPNHGNTASTELVALTASPQAIDHNSMRKAYGLKATEWFDVENIHTGWEGRGPPAGLALIWIDAERERFYYYWTD